MSMYAMKWKLGRAASEVRALQNTSFIVFPHSMSNIIQSIAKEVIIIMKIKEYLKRRPVYETYKTTENN